MQACKIKCIPRTYFLKTNKNNTLHISNNDVEAQCHIFVRLTDDIAIFFDAIGEIGGF